MLAVYCDGRTTYPPGAVRAYGEQKKEKEIKKIDFPTVIRVGNNIG